MFSKRIYAVEMSFNNVSLFLCSVYMSTLSPVNVEEYRSTSIELSALIKAADCNYTIIGGDCNTSLVQSNRHQQILTKFMSEEALVCSLTHQCSDVKFSYESKSNHCRSLLDHILVSCNIFDKILNYQCLYEIDNLPDHFPMSMDLNISVDTLDKSVHVFDSVNVHINWDKIQQSDILNYQYIPDECLNTSVNKYGIFHCNDFKCTNIKHKYEIKSLYTNIVEACLSAGNVAFTNKKSKTKKQGQKIPGCSVYVKGPKGKACSGILFRKQMDVPMMVCLQVSGEAPGLNITGQLNMSRNRKKLSEQIMWQIVCFIIIHVNFGLLLGKLVKVKMLFLPM